MSDNKDVGFKERMNKQGEEVKAKVKKMGKVKFTLLIIMTLATVCAFVFRDYVVSDGDKNVFYNLADGIVENDYLLSGFFSGILNLLPHVIKALQIITIGLVAASVIMTVIDRIFSKSQRKITVVKLVNSIIKWVTAVVLVIAVLAVWGVDTTALITGAGVITLVVGLGLQDLIEDVVAGLFIVFENEFNVGDIITVDGFRGKVTEIGIRTTRLEAAGNVKIFNNSSITGVLNQTVKPSLAKVLIDVEYGESLSRVEEVMAEKLPLVEVEGVLGEIKYDGVSDLGSSGVTLQFSASCNESDIYSVQRAMRRRIKDLFDENGIGIPFPQLVVHNADRSCD